MTTVLLHGFWGHPQDWNQVLQALPLEIPVWIPDLYETGPLAPPTPLAKWVENFLSELERRFGAEESVQLVGYSMGARLALNAWVREPRRFARALLLSAAPYISSTERAEREQWEEDWSQRFLSQSWSELQSAWQDQPVLATSAPVERRQSDELRERLAGSLKNWSVRHHPFGIDETKALPASVDWAFGAMDQKYSRVAKTLRELPVRGQIIRVPNAGHRLLTDAPAEIAAWIKQGKREP
ncbi:MAG: alpha/beta fold hydrolase [Bdellovibrionales bacterium]